MDRIIFIDTEVRSNKVADTSCIFDDMDGLHTNSPHELEKQLQNAEFICGHNIIKHDRPWLEKFLKKNLTQFKFIDTLYLSPLLFPSRPYHKLLKDDRLQTEELNNPLNDAQKAKDLFYDEVNAFLKIDERLKNIYYGLLRNQEEFKSFFQFIGYSPFDNDLESLIRDRFSGMICERAQLDKLIEESAIELAYCLALINASNRYSITPPGVVRNYPDVERLMHLLRNNPCIQGCAWCNQQLDGHKALRNFFGFHQFLSYDGKPLQQEAVEAAINNESLLTIFPTGGGKSLTFQLPALMSGENVRGLTVVISPLQSLMKDQVDNLEKANITEAVTINGLLDPVERQRAIERIEEGDASILYISPESLRSRTIERLLLGRKIVRFVIDEAHCFSAWGHDFRVDYLYLGDFIQSLQDKKNLTENIPISCFTATAKQDVIQDIKNYFRDKLNIDLKVLSTSTTRSNLEYKVIQKKDEEEKYWTIRNLIDAKNCPAIIYVSRTKKAFQLAERLNQDGYQAKPYHGKMDKQEKSANQNSFINGETQIIVATSAFGMGVDKKDVGMVIHFDISDSLENYVQEAGRAGRDENITAECYVLYNEEDLSKHFILLNQTKLHIKEIQQVWKAIKGLTRMRSKVSGSALEIARRAGWDDNVAEIESRVITAIAALEEAGYLKRGQNMPKIYANSILTKTAQQAIDKINASDNFTDKQRIQAVRIIKKLFSGKNKKEAIDEEAETRIDYISDHLGIVKEDVIRVVNLLREENILADTKDLTAFIKRNQTVNRSSGIAKTFANIEKFLLSQIDQEEKIFHLKELNELAEQEGLNNVSVHKMKTIINFWAIKNWITRKTDTFSKNHISIKSNFSNKELLAILEKRHLLSQFIIDFLFKRSNEHLSYFDKNKEQILVSFSVQELKQEYEKKNLLFQEEISNKDIEDALFYLSRIDAIKIEGGFLVIYNRLSLERLEEDNKKRYKNEDYKRLRQFYENKVQQIHIVGEYAKKMINDYKGALQFVEDYFQLNYSSFLNKYFNPNQQKELRRNVTPAKFKQLFGRLSPAQLSIIKDKTSPSIVVAAGPGSGKTRVLVHKLASLLLMEDVKHEHLLMVTFSRAAANEFKIRLQELIGNAASFVEIKTFHSYCFDILGKVGSIEKSDKIIENAITKIENHEIEPNRIAKTVLVIDEAQDMDAQEFKLINILMEQNEEMRVIAVGDDDQNIYEFRGSSSKYLGAFLKNHQSKKYELTDNYRSKNNLVLFTNHFAESISKRIKEHPVMAVQKDNGTVHITNYSSQHLITPLVNNILSTDLVGSTCILTQTNAEAQQITGFLNARNMPAKLIQSNDGFNLNNLLEIRYFMNSLDLSNDKYIISDDTWQQAKRNVYSKYKESTTFEICKGLIKTFEKVNPKHKYKTDFKIFIRESKIEDFAEINREIINVSTIHKAKGKEFDNVFLMLNNYAAGSDENKRQLYVAITRAKRFLSIHDNNRIFDPIAAPGLQEFTDSNHYGPPGILHVHTSHKDIWLDYFFSIQNLISNYKSGDKLKADKNGCLNSAGQYIVKFSNRFKESLADYEQQGFELDSASINFIIYWHKENDTKEIKIILPEIKLTKLK